mgnify:CR=1 FL=1
MAFVHTKFIFCQKEIITMANIDLTQYGITGATEIIHNPSYEELAKAELIKWHNESDKFYHIHATGKVGYDNMIEIRRKNGI